MNGVIDPDCAAARVRPHPRVAAAHELAETLGCPGDVFGTRPLVGPEVTDEGRDNVGPGRNSLPRGDLMALTEISRGRLVRRSRGLRSRGRPLDGWWYAVGAFRRPDRQVDVPADRPAAFAEVARRPRRVCNVVKFSVSNATAVCPGVTVPPAAQAEVVVLRQQDLRHPLLGPANHIGRSYHFVRLAAALTPMSWARLTSPLGVRSAGTDPRRAGRR